ncbi:MAG: hypothetical protein IJC86_00220 [Clostridia bacterium]|nr:hypothetical protein [Clostridia bacterium]
MLKKLKQDAFLFAVGGVSYGLIEILWRQRTHWSMVLTGGACFLILYKLYGRFPRLSVPERCVIGSLIITGMEFYVGCIVNLWLGLGVWDYSAMPLNLLGQICIFYSVLWGILSIPISVLCRFMTHRFDCTPAKNKA